MRLRSAAAWLLLPLALAGCTTNIYGQPLDGSSAPSDTSTDHPCYQQGAAPGEGSVDQECVGDLVDERMAGNDMYRQRMTMPEDVAAAGEALLPTTTAQLEALRATGSLSEDKVVATLEGVGLTSVQIRGADGSYVFGAQPPEGGCLFGSVTSDAVTVEAGGYIMDGGCLPAH